MFTPFKNIRSCLIALTLIIISSNYNADAQELNCLVQVNVTSKTQLADQSIFRTLETSLSEFINNKKWTSGTYKPEERIDAVLSINITKELSLSRFEAEATIQCSRPVYNSSYGTPTFMHVDKDFTFEYSEYQPLLFNENIFSDNLTSLIAFYVHIIIGMDHETFSLKGGQDYFLKAQAIVNNAQNTSFGGWKPHEGTRNRYWIIENLLNPNYEPLRNVLYKYHRNGLDIMFKDLAPGRKVITECLNSLVEIFEQYPNSMIMHLFFSAKSDELVGIYSKASPSDKAKAFQLLSKMNAANTNKYKKLLK